jgi:hypothetical protein
VRTIQAAALAELHSIEWLLGVIRSVGLVPIPDAETTYEGEAEYLNASQQGLIQLPREFARWLLLLAAYRPASYLEIGCFNGASACPRRRPICNASIPDFRPRRIDVWPAFTFCEQVRELLAAALRRWPDFVRLRH